MKKRKGCFLISVCRFIFQIRIFDNQKQYTQNRTRQVLISFVAVVVIVALVFLLS